MKRERTSPAGCLRRGTAYVAFSQWASALLLYTVVYHLLEPPEEYLESDGAEAAVSGGSDSSAGAGELLDSESPSLAAWEHGDRTPWLTRLIRATSLTPPMSTTVGAAKDGEPQPLLGSPRPLTASPCLMSAPRIVRKMAVVAEHTPLLRMLQPPIVASLLAIAVGAAPPAKAALFGPHAPLGFVTDSMGLMAAALVPCVMLVLGGNLVAGPGAASRLGAPATVAICVARLVVLPALGFGAVVAADAVGLIGPRDPMLRFVLLLQHAMPTSILAGAMASVRGYGDKEAASLLFWQHAFAAVTLPAYIALFMHWLV
eukprot:SM000003S11089  [mRNA]  locus=s3:865778:868360:+ [translate_table: standard]